ncbi:hypothetical protein SADUNF_Sadunf16G0141600 [Salix dunnii]|uniref:Uncharacterized protein n=1 Tax=Salix dunnii TaxID=1413687 RepID=A0A835MLS7_9ROSI|nr:hypothetical protein SADUNF_Sadunf16G0141600 [Salix dunnii]
MFGVMDAEETAWTNTFFTWLAVKFLCSSTLSGSPRYPLWFPIWILEGVALANCELMLKLNWQNFQSSRPAKLTV